MKGKVKNLLLTGGVVSIVISGCSLAYFPYFRNYSNKPVEMVFKISDWHKDNLSPIYYSDEILPINKKTHKKLNDSLPVNNLQDNKASIIIPPYSTILLPRLGAYNTDTFFLKQENRLDSISIVTPDGRINSFQTKRFGFPVAYIYYYDLSKC